MKKETADALCQVLHSLSAEYERRDNYRGINNPKPTTAIVLGDVQSLLAAATAAVTEMNRRDIDGPVHDLGEMRQFCKDVGRFAIDQDGTGSDIVVY